MKILIILAIFLISQNLFAEENDFVNPDEDYLFNKESESSGEYFNYSFSIDPVGIASYLLFSKYTEGEDTYIDWNKVWFACDFNVYGKNKTEFGIGLFLSGYNVALVAKHRSFFNKERLSGFFYGFYGLVEWRRMHWWYGDSGLNTDLIFPAVDKENIYHTIGVTAGLDIGFRFRGKNNDFGITPYLGLGLPVFLRFGDAPPQSKLRFNMMNIGIRAIHLGVRLDSFAPFGPSARD